MPIAAFSMHYRSGAATKLSPTKAARRTGTTLKTIRKYATAARSRCAAAAISSRRGPAPAADADADAQGEFGRPHDQLAHSRRVSRTTITRCGLCADAATRASLEAFRRQDSAQRWPVYTFATDHRTIDRHVRAGAVHFVDIYVRGAAV